MLEIERIANEIDVKEYREKENNYKADYVFEPLYRGYGNTIGNALRRVLLSSIPGTAIKGIMIEGVLNEFSTMEGIRESVTDIILNIKEIVVKSETPGEKKMTLSVKGPRKVTGKDIFPDSEIIVVNPEQEIAEITTDRELNIEFLVDTGEGFVVAEEIEKESWPIGYMSIDALYGPIKKVSYFVEDTMVGRITNFDKLTLEIETNGSIEVRSAISYAAELIIKHLNPILSIGNKMEYLRSNNEEIEEVEEQVENKVRDIKSIKLDELDLTVRSYNCLKKAGIESLGELSDMGIPNLLKIKNLGRKSLTEIIDKLKEYGFELSNE